MYTPNRKMIILLLATRHASITRQKWHWNLFAGQSRRWSRPCSAIVIHQVNSSASRHAGCGTVVLPNGRRRLRKEGATAVVGALSKLAKTISQGIRLFEGDGYTPGYTRSYTQKAVCKVVADGLTGKGAAMEAGRSSSCSTSGLAGASESHQSMFRLRLARWLRFLPCRISPTFESDGLWRRPGKG